MLTSAEILAAYRERVIKSTGVTSAYRAAKELGVPQTQLAQWERGKGIGPKYAVKIGVFCQIDARYLVACLEAERSRDPISRSFWASLASEYAPPPAALERFRDGEAAQPEKKDLYTFDRRRPSQSAAAN